MVGTIKFGIEQSVLRPADTGRSDDSTPAYVRVIHGHCSRPAENAELFKHMIEIPHEWMNVICHSRAQRYLDKKTVEWSGLQEE